MAELVRTARRTPQLALLLGGGIGLGCVFLIDFFNEKSAVEQMASDEESCSELDEDSIRALIVFFTLLDKWDREAKQNGKIV